MKNKLIISLWNAVFGSIKKEKGYKNSIKTMVVIGTLFAVGCIDAVKQQKRPVGKKSSAQQRRQLRQQRLGGRQMVAPTTPAVQITPAVASKEEEWGKYQRDLMKRALTETPSQMLIYIQQVKGRFAPLTKDQTDWLEKLQDNILLSQKLQNQGALLKQQEMLLQQQRLQLQLQQQQPEAKFSPSGAVKGAAEAGKQVAGGVKGYYDWMKEKLYNALTGSYVSGMGSAKYIAPAVLIAAAGPVGMMVGALGGLAIGGASAAGIGLSGLGVWGLSNIADRANFMALSGGHGTTESWLKTLRAQLSFILDNKAAYPYLSAKISALESKNELMPADETTGVVRKLHDTVLREHQIEKSKIQPGSVEAQREELFNNYAQQIRTANEFASSTIEGYIAKLRANDDLIRAEAFVSEYNRALNRKTVQDIIANKRAGVSEAIITPATLETSETPATGAGAGAAEDVASLLE